VLGGPATRRTSDQRSCGFSVTRTADTKGAARDVSARREFHCRFQGAGQPVRSRGRSSSASLSAAETVELPSFAHRRGGPFTSTRADNAGRLNGDRRSNGKAQRRELDVLVMTEKWKRSALSTEAGFYKDYI